VGQFLDYETEQNMEVSEYLLQNSALNSNTQHQGN
jgi:hypothetical protein